MDNVPQTFCEHNEAVGKNKYKVAIQDNGPGIVKKQIPLVFVNFLMEQTDTCWYRHFNVRRQQDCFCREKQSTLALPQSEIFMHLRKRTLENTPSFGYSG